MPVVETVNAKGPARAGGWVQVCQIALLASIYMLAGRFGLSFGEHHEIVTLIWPPTGIALAALILYGRHLWPGVFLGALGINLWASSSPFVALGIATGNTLESVAGATLLCSVTDFRPTLERPRDVAAFLLIGVVGCTTISATIGVTSLAIFGGLEPDLVSPLWLTWWLGDAGGALVLTPVLLLSIRGAPPWKALLRRFEAWAALGCLILVSGLAFFGPDIGLLGFAACVAPFPILAWTGTRLGPRGAVVGSFFIIGIAALATSQNSGPFVLGTSTEAILLLWAYSMFIGSAAFTLAAVIEQRDVADRRRLSEEAERIRSEKEKGLLLERERLTREMHDGLGGQLISVLSMVERGHAPRSEIAEGLRRAIDDVRIVTDSLDPNATEMSTSLGQLRTRLEPLLRRNGIGLVWQIEEIPDLQTFPPGKALHILRIIQEGVTNTLRHADAAHVEVRMTTSSAPDDSSARERRLHVTIRDDGCGLRPTLDLIGRGLKNMTSRAAELGGSIRIDDADPGTKISLTVPFPG